MMLVALGHLILLLLTHVNAQATTTCTALNRNNLVAHVSSSNCDVIELLSKPTAVGYNTYTITLSIPVGVNAPPGTRVFQPAHGSTVIEGLLGATISSSDTILHVRQTISSPPFSALFDVYVGGTSSETFLDDALVHVTASDVVSTGANVQVSKCNEQGWFCKSNRFYGSTELSNQIAVIGTTTLVVRGVSSSSSFSSSSSSSTTLLAPFCNGNQQLTQAAVSGSGTLELHRILFDACFSTLVKVSSDQDVVVLRVSDQASLILRDVDIANNGQDSEGNAIPNTDGTALQILDQGTATIIDSTFRGNLSPKCGGAIYIGPAAEAVVMSSLFLGVRNFSVICSIVFF